MDLIRPRWVLWLATCGFCAKWDGSESDGGARSATTHLRSSKEYVLMGTRARSPAGLERGAPGLGRDSISCGERTSGDTLRANSGDIVDNNGGLAIETGTKGCWTERPRIRRTTSGSRISIRSISMAL